MGGGKREKKKGEGGKVMVKGGVTCAPAQPGMLRCFGKAGGGCIYAASKRLDGAWPELGRGIQGRWAQPLLHQ